MNFGRIIEQCRMCDSSELYEFLDLGFLPPADKILTKHDLQNHEIHFPLRVAQCQSCGLTQLTYAVNPELLYGETYSYESSITETGKKHFFEMADTIVKKYNLAPRDFVVDIGSNVGVLLEGFKQHGMRVLGVDAAPRIVTIANKRGIETIQGLMNTAIAEHIVRERGKARIITATNVFAHIDDKKEFMASIQRMLDDEGIFVIEAPYLVDLLEQLEYDTIYLDHLEYLSLKPLLQFFKKYNMEVCDVETYSIHGTSARVFVCWKNKQKISTHVNEMLAREEEKGIYKKEYLDEFSEKVKQHKHEFLQLIHELKKQRKKIVGISAPAKGNTLLNYCKLHEYHIEYMAEKSTIKVNHFTPGMHIPIIEESHLLKTMPDYGIIFAWNFAEEIMKNNSEFLKRGGKFIIPIPKPVIIDNNNAYNPSTMRKTMNELFGVKIEKIDPVFIDERGIISDLLNEPVSHVGLITTEKNALRGSHYHKKSKQYSYILSGTFEVTLAPYDQPEKIKKVVLRAGELITIPPFVIHQFKALDKAVMINVESESRKGQGYEDDTIRVKLEV
jgi:quercetin dioxygenase-like cupin family protein/SAM-dependent methyltransferase